MKCCGCFAAEGFPVTEEVSYKPQELRAIAEQANRSVAVRVRSAEMLVMDAARYQDVQKWGDDGLEVTQSFGKLYEERLLGLEKDVRELLQLVSTFSDDVKKAAREAGRQDEQVAEDLSSAARSLASSSTNAYAARRASVWEG